MTYYIQISTTNWPKDRLLFEDIMNTLEKLCDVQNGYILNEPVSKFGWTFICLLYTSPSPRDGLLSRMPSSA